MYSNRAQYDSRNSKSCQCILSSLVSCLVKQKQRDQHSEDYTLKFFDIAINKCAVSSDKSAIQHHNKLLWLEVNQDNQQQTVIVMHLDSGQ